MFPQSLVDWDMSSGRNFNTGRAQMVWSLVEIELDSRNQILKEIAMGIVNESELVLHAESWFSRLALFNATNC